MSAAPIDISYRQNEPNRIGFSRDAVAHSQGVGGISWGAASVGSWLRDEILTTTINGAPFPPGGNQANSHSIGMGSTGSGVAAAQGGQLGLNVLGTSPRDILFPSLEHDFCRDYSCCGENLPTLHDLLRHYEDAHISPSPTEEAPVLKRMQGMEAVPTNDVFLPPAGSNSALGLGDRQADTQDVFGRPTYPQTTGNGGLPPTVPLPPSVKHMTQTSMGNNNNGASTRRSVAGPQDEDDATIDDPARQLYVIERQENKPYRCPVIGCDKMYKNQNGLKYHRQHGHQNQKLHQNPDGTFSIIDPLSNTPYPDGMGMEKDKPYRCEICGKRYKNLNGLKYHRAHSTH